MNNYLIVGPPGNIGQELAKQIAESGNQDIANFHKHEPELTNLNIQFHHLNVLEDNISSDFLPDQLEGLVYGPGSTSLRPFERIKPSYFESDFKLQVIGVIKLLQLVLPRLKKSTNASVVLFSAVAIQTGLAFPMQVSTSKGTIEGFTRAFAAEYAPNIKVNGIAPPLTDTPLASSFLNNEQKREANTQRYPLKRIGPAADVANMAPFLVSEKASWITGQIVNIDGGMSSLKI